MTVLTRRALNRAALARQMLLARADVTALDAVAHLGGMQAQEPLEPYTGLWSRLAGFVPDDLAGLLTGRQAVRTHLMRHTVHLVTADDALAWRALHVTMMRRRGRAVVPRNAAAIDLDELAALAEPLFAAEPVIVPEVARALSGHWPDVDHRPLVHMMYSALPLIQVPPRALWGVAATAPARTTTYPAWVGRAAQPWSDDALDELVLRHLAAYGPAASADVRAWCGIAGLPAVITRVRDRLVEFRDERGRVLLDLPDAPRPDPDTPAPVRFLPAFDNAVLGYDDRSRVIDDAHRGLSITGARFVLVDGRVAATWAVTAGVVEVTPLVRFRREDRTAVAEEGRALAGFLSEGASHRVRVAASPR